MTSGGNESGARPILDAHREEVENRDVCCGLWANAGTRKAGSVTSRAVAVEKAFDMARDERIQCLVASIAVEYRGIH